MVRQTSFPNRGRDSVFSFGAGGCPRALGKFEAGFRKVAEVQDRFRKK